MKAVVQRQYGSPDLLEVAEVPMPAVGDGDVRVRVRAASLHPDVWHVVAGRPAILRLMGAGWARPRQPIPGTDMAGVVEAVGAGVTRFRPGDAVFGETIAGMQWVNGGAFAEYVSVPQQLLAHKPDTVGFEQAASVPTAGYIVLLNLPDPAELGAGRRVLVVGAGGGVGTLVVQIAKAHGAHVTAVDVAGKTALLRGLGADAVIDYTREDVTRRGDRFDLIVDVPVARGYRAWRPLLTAAGRYVPIGHDHYGRSGRRVFGMVPYFVTLLSLGRLDRHLRGSAGPPPAKGDAIETLRGLLARGVLTPPIDRVYPLADVREAFRHLMHDELHGKVILAP